jgi:hypothetical protein
LSSRLERTRISYFAPLATTACTVFFLAAAPYGSAALPFVISTGAQRSGEICGFSGPLLIMFFDRPNQLRRIRLYKSSPISATGDEQHNKTFPAAGRSSGSGA